MLDSGKRNPNCEFAEEVVTYLYDELQDSKKAEFENHLGSCPSCPDELAAFASLSSSVRNWRDAEFANIATPPIEIPFGRHLMSVSKNEDSNPWVERLRAIFGFSPSFLKTTAAFGAFAILVGLGWFLISSLSTEKSNIAVLPKEMSGSAVKGTESVEIPKEAKIEKKENANVRAPEPKTNEIVSVADDSAIKSEKISSKKPASKPIVKSPRLAKKPAKPRVTKVEKPLEFEEIPRLTTEVAVDEADDLRLSDIFSEVGNDR